MTKMLEAKFGVWKIETIIEGGKPYGISFINNLGQEIFIRADEDFIFKRDSQNDGWRTDNL
jgi:hypothetical protein